MVWTGCDSLTVLSRQVPQARVIQSRAMEHGAKEVELMRKKYELRRNYIVRSLNDLGLPCFKPLGAFYVFPQITSTGLTSQEFSMACSRKRKSPASRVRRRSAVPTELQRPRSPAPRARR